MQILENRPIKDVTVPGLKRHGITIKNSTSSTSGDLEGAQILKDPSHPGSVRISYRPRLELLQSLLKSNHALQFSVKYDVDRSFDKGEGEIQVRAGSIIKFRENCLFVEIGGNFQFFLFEHTYNFRIFFIFSFSLIYSKNLHQNLEKLQTL